MTSPSIFQFEINIKEMYVSSWRQYESMLQSKAKSPHRFTLLIRASSSGQLYRAFRALATLGQLPEKSKLATAFRVPITQLSNVRKL